MIYKLVSFKLKQFYKVKSILGDGSNFVKKINIWKIKMLISKFLSGSDNFISCKYIVNDTCNCPSDT